MRMHLQHTTDVLTIVMGAADVRAFMAERAGLRPRQFAAKRADDLKED